MNSLELFAGTGSFGKIAFEKGYNNLSLDMDGKSDITISIMDWDYKKYPPNSFDIIWSSPPCTEYSHLQYGYLNRMRKGKIFTREVWEDNMKEADKILERTLLIIDYFKPKYWFIENPATSRMKERHLIKDLPFYIVDYCKYSDWGYRKRTRIWTNLENFKPLLCKKDCGSIVDGKHKNNLGNSERAKITNSKNYSQQDRYRIPPKLIRDLLHLID